MAKIRGEQENKWIILTITTTNRLVQEACYDGGTGALL
jgi:hypothetical protein